MKNKGQHSKRKTIWQYILLIFIVIFFMGAIRGAVYINNALYEQGNIKTEKIENLDKKKVTNKIQDANHPTEYSVYLNEFRENPIQYSTLENRNDNLRYTETLQCIELALAQYGINFDIDTFYQDYMSGLNEVDQSVTEIQGLPGPDGTEVLINNYLQDNDCIIRVKHFKNVDIETLKQMLKNNWPIVIYYTGAKNSFSGETDYWPYAKPFLGKEITDDRVILFDPIEDIKEYQLYDFLNIWGKTGQHILIFS